MSNSLATRAFFEGLAAAVATAWPTVTRTYPGQPDEAPSAVTLPYATIDWDGAAMAFTGSGRKGSVEQAYTFDVYGMFAYPEDPTAIILLEASDRADELIAQLQPGPTFTPYGYLPLVTGVTPIGTFGSGEEAYGVKVSFSVKANADHS